jgi:hypothetical protein
MAGYWGPVLSGAWEKTRNPLGWDRKKFAVVLLAIGSIIAAGVHFGIAEMIATASGLFWIAFPSIFAMSVLFVWGIIETQAKLYSDLMTSSTATISNLENQLSRFEKYKPNYEIWRKPHKYTLIEAAYLWVERVPHGPGTSETTAQYRALESAVQTGKLRIIYRSQYASDRSAKHQHPNVHTEILRESLQEYAQNEGQVPIFLRDS